ncbi:nucleotidyltransferase family protein [Fulvivirga sp. RKSG066]|uniref:nucleotidyltransferase family protein n=1 Tax=Fulvivirga aurantia TaxID=2529383 RepID=UPI0012BB5ED8|nr:nucleotidyltransferase family protein [Fulvivirga aurantia]MTI19972.1 nucleotidyltransferase family protein [Fulvivirga aurantia]
MDEIGVIVLAAGESSRMSGSKQLLRVGSESLLRKSTRTAMTLRGPTVVVLGSDYQKHKNEIADLDVEVIFNLDWRKGMGNSLKYGLNHLNHNFPFLEGVIIMVCDQPQLEVNTLYKMIEHYDEQNPIIAATYNGAVGVPVLFSRLYFKELLKIPDDRGAKLLIEKYGAKVVAFPQGEIDIDTDDDWQSYLNED